MQFSQVQPFSYPPARIGLSDEFISPSSIFLFSQPIYPITENLFQDLNANYQNIFFKLQNNFNNISKNILINEKKDTKMRDYIDISNISEEVKITSICNTVSLETELIKLNYDLLTGIYPFYDEKDDFKNSLGFKMKINEKEEVQGRIFSNGTVTFSSLKTTWNDQIYQKLYDYIKNIHDLNKLVIPKYYNSFASEKGIIRCSLCSTITNFEIFKIHYNKLYDLFILNKNFVVGDKCLKIIKIREPLDTGSGFFVKFEIDSDVISFTIFDSGRIQARNSGAGENLILYYNLFHKLLTYFKPVIENKNYVKKTRNRKYKSKKNFLIK